MSLCCEKCKTTIWSWLRLQLYFPNWDASSWILWFSIAIDVRDSNSLEIKPFHTTGTLNTSPSIRIWMTALPQDSNLKNASQLASHRAVKTKNFYENLKEGKMSTLSQDASKNFKIFQVDLPGWGWMMMNIMKHKILIDINCNIDRPDRPCGCMSTYFLLPLVAVIACRMSRVSWGQDTMRWILRFRGVKRDIGKTYPVWVCRIIPQTVW